MDTIRRARGMRGALGAALTLACLGASAEAQTSDQFDHDATAFPLGMVILAMLTWPTIALGYVINLFERGSASMGRINQILDARPKVIDCEPLDHQASIQGGILVQDLSFSYNGEPALKEVSFNVLPGQTLAIVGRTGSGKSTLVDLLCRLHPVADGHIFLDGVDINRIPLRTLRKSIGYAPQDAFLLPVTA